MLSDANKRAQYDRFGTVSGAAGGGSGYVDFDDLFGGGFGDIFSSFFGGGGAGGARQQRTDGRDMGVGLRLTLEEVATGAKKEIVYDRLAPCADCDGTGMAEGGSRSLAPNAAARVVWSPCSIPSGRYADGNHLQQVQRHRSNHRQPVPRMRRPRPSARPPARHGRGTCRHPRFPAAVP